MHLNQLKLIIKKFLMKCLVHNNEIIVSLTSYPKRINKIKQTLDSIFNQTIQPDKILLWLSNSEFENK